VVLTEALSGFLGPTGVGIRSNSALKLAEALIDCGHDTKDAFNSLTAAELLGLGFADGHIKCTEAYRARVGLTALVVPEGVPPAASSAGAGLPLRVLCIDGGGIPPSILQCTPIAIARHSLTIAPDIDRYQGAGARDRDPAPGGALRQAGT
jgi:hypothetical protein